MHPRHLKQEDQDSPYVIVQIVCFVENRFALDLSNITSGTTCHASETSGSEEDFNIFLYISIVGLDYNKLIVYKQRP